MNFPIKELLTFLKRLLGLPFFMGLLLISLTCQFFLKSYLWLRYGGEAINYNDKMNKKTVSDIFYAIQEVAKSDG